jgi:hypothetical protein
VGMGAVGMRRVQWRGKSSIDEEVGQGSEDAFQFLSMIVGPTCKKDIRSTVWEGPLESATSFSLKILWGLSFVGFN